MCSIYLHELFQQKLWFVPLQQIISLVNGEIPIYSALFAITTACLLILSLSSITEGGLQFQIKKTGNAGKPNITTLFLKTNAAYTLANRVAL